MAHVTQQHKDTPPAHQQKSSKPAAETSLAPVAETSAAEAAQAREDPRAMTPQNVVALQRAMGNRAVQRLIQPKLTARERALGDQYEQEADKVAAQVMTMREPQASVQRETTPEEEDQAQAKRASLVAQRQATPEENELQAKPLAQRQAMPEEDELQAKPLVQRKGDGSFETDEAFALRVNASRGGGSPLPDETRGFMESRFSADFSGVRVHTGSEAAQLSQSAQAQAFTHGSDIYFNEGKYNPDTGDGKRLLAHELTHTIQQTGGIQRKVDYQFIGNVGTVAGALKDRDKQFKKIMEAYKQYTKAVDLGAELATLNEIIQQCRAYLNGYKGQNGKKDQDATLLAAECQRELPHVQYMRKLQTNQFKFLTLSGGLAANPYESDKQFAKQHQLSDAELRAIKIYTAGDFKYMNPVLLNNESLLDLKIGELTSPSDKSPVPEWGVEKGIQGGKATAEQKRQIEAEGMEHSNMAGSGLQKLPNWTGSIYRGMALSSQEFKKMFQVGKAVVFPSFTSTSTEADAPRRFAAENAKGDKVGIFLIISATKGKDVSKISFVKSENEILLPPGSVFIVNKITPAAKDGDYTVVEMTQTV